MRFNQIKNPPARLLIDVGVTDNKKKAIVNLVLEFNN